MTLQQLLFPGIGDDENSRLRDGALDMANAYLRWENKQTKHKDEHQVSLMSESEIEELARML